MARCRRCGRAITDPESVRRGYGPKCHARRTREYDQRRSTLDEVINDG